MRLVCSAQDTPDRLFIASEGSEEAILDLMDLEGLQSETAVQGESLIRRAKLGLDDDVAAFTRSVFAEILYFLAALFHWHRWRSAPRRSRGWWRCPGGINEEGDERRSDWRSQTTAHAASYVLLPISHPSHYSPWQPVYDDDDQLALMCPHPPLALTCCLLSLMICGVGGRIRRGALMMSRC